jgi:GMP synthase PP-ATPase subunit
MNFKQWLILSEELYTQNNTATIFHRTIFEYVRQMMNDGFRAGEGDFHGPGLYTTYTLEGTTNLGYGDYVVKLKVNNLNNYFVLEPDVAKQIHGNNWKLKDQARILKLTLKLTDEQWQKYQKISEDGEFGSAAASRALKDDEHFLWEHKCKGIVYNGAQDGKCICVYAPYEGLKFLAYAYAPTPTTVDFIEKNWIKSGQGVSIRSISDLKFPNEKIGFTSVEKQYDLEEEKVIPSQILDDVRKSEYVKLRFYMKKNKLTGDNVFHLLLGAPDKEKMAEILGSDNINKINREYVRFLLDSASNRQEMINLIIKYKTEFSGEDVHNLLSGASDKEKIARILGQNNIDKLTVRHVHNLLSDASDIEEMGRILRQNNIDKLTDGHVHNLLSGASDKEKIARILGQNNIDKLTVGSFYGLLSGASDKEKIVEILGPDNINQFSDHHVYYLLSGASDKDQMARILGQENIEKLSSDNVHSLLYRTLDKEKMAEILGPKNIAKLSDDYVKYFIDNAKNPEEMARILGKENIEKIHK